MTNKIVEKFLKDENDAGGTIRKLELELESETKWAEQYFKAWQSAQQSVYLTAFGAGGLGFVIGFWVCWFVYHR